jgi:hypothetical protein
MREYGVDTGVGFEGLGRAVGHAIEFRSGLGDIGGMKNEWRELEGFLVGDRGAKGKGTGNL